ncbi:MAG: LysR family transcriptional regulator [Clostridia bacterium]|nr:LysR family transcriptional regulator [Clostridia bacterium]
MDFKQLESFVTIAKLNSFSKAADKLFLTQPTISNHILSLEKELDTVLFNRTNKKITLTHSGEILYEYAVSILNKRDSAFFSLNQFKGKIEGILEIASSTIPEQYYLTEILTKFHISYPDVKFDLKKYDTKQVLDKINLGEIDFGIVGAEKDIRNIEFIPIFDDEIVLIAPNRPPYDKMDTISFENVLKHPLIIREKGSGTRQRFQNEVEAHNYEIEDLNCVGEIESNETIKKMVSRGLGLSFVSNRSIQNELKLGQLKIIDVKDFQMKRNFYFVFHQKRALSPLARTFRDFILSMH